MQKHVKNYLDLVGKDVTDFIGCEYCSAKAVDIHHVIPRSKFGKKRKDEQDHPNNLIALCRKHHDLAHSSKEFNESLKEIVLRKRN